MRVLSALLVALTVLTPSLASQDGHKFDYQSDVARLRKIVINSLYSHRDVFLRELISNANDALEKLRITSLVDKEVLGGAEDLNITIRAWKEEDGTAKLAIRDTGIGMTPEELTKNLGTLAKSGTSEFLARAESGDTSNTGNLIGAFGVGFYSSFLVADKVYVTSLAAKTAKNPEPVQRVFSSSSEESTFEVYPDERGNTLGRGTEITLVLKNDALDYLDPVSITTLVDKHSGFSTTFPIYLFTQRTEEVPVDDEIPIAETAEEAAPVEKTDDDDEEEAVVVEDVEEKVAEEKEVETKSVVVDEWVHLNSQPPIWTRDPKTISSEEYEEFYKATFKEYMKPLAWNHFTGDTGSGTTFRAILFIPGHLDDTYWANPLQSAAKDIRLMVKRVFITSDLGEDALPKWATWVKVVIDADDLPLNVSRETLQSTKFLKQIRSIILKRLIQTMQKVREAANPDDEFLLKETYNNIFKLGAVEDTKNRDKLGALVKFPTNHRNETTLEEYLANRKEGQKQIFYLADMGKSIDELSKSVFVEKLHARGYEVLLLGEALDEVFVQNLNRWKKFPFQDVAKAGLKFGDEESDAEEKEQHEAYTVQYKPLLDWLKNETSEFLRDVVVSNRLVTSPCAIVADAFGYTANMEKLLHSQQQSTAKLVHDYAKKLKVLEINPRSPLIEGLLKRIEQLPSEEDERDIEAEDEIKEVISVLIDSALVRSGFDVPSANGFFVRMDRILRRSLGVSETAPTDSTVKPAPPTTSEPIDDEEFEFDDSHMQLDPEALGLKVGEPVLFDDAEAEKPAAEFKAEVVGDDEAAQKPLSHDEL